MDVVKETAEQSADPKPEGTTSEKIADIVSQLRNDAESDVFENDGKLPSFMFDNTGNDPEAAPEEPPPPPDDGAFNRENFRITTELK